MELDLEEQARLYALKTFWQRWRLVILVVLTVALLALSGWQGLKKYNSMQAADAGKQFELLAQAFTNNDEKAVNSALETLKTRYPKTQYASIGLFMAVKRFHVLKDYKSATNGLEWLVANAFSIEWKEMARLYWIHVLLDENKLDAAIKLLEAKPTKGFEARYDEARGDVYFMQGKKQEAVEAYQRSLQAARKSSKPELSSAREEALTSGLVAKLAMLGVLSSGASGV